MCPWMCTRLSALQVGLYLDQLLSNGILTPSYRMVAYRDKRHLIGSFPIRLAGLKVWPRFIRESDLHSTHAFAVPKIHAFFRSWGSSRVLE